ncbi:hypothetical protein LSAT2_001325, partial [Lamellibrachia satsuma]
ILLAIVCVAVVDGSTQYLTSILEGESCLLECEREYQKCRNDILKKSCPYLSDPISGEEYCHYDFVSCVKDCNDIFGETVKLSQ